MSERDFVRRANRAVSQIVFCLVLFYCSIAGAQSNPELLRVLNDARRQECVSKRQCEHHEDRFNISIPYNRIIVDKEQIIRALTDLIVSLGGVADAVAPVVPQQPRLFQALTADAYAQIELLLLYDQVLGEFGHPEARRIISRAKNLAMAHLLMLNLRSQELLDEELSAVRDAPVHQ